MKNLHITCDTIEQRRDVMSVLDNAGFRIAGDLLPCKYDIQTTETVYANMSKRKAYDTFCRPKITYTQFMEKYAVNKLTNKINEAMTELKISKAELSRRIGKHRNYLGSIQQVGATTKKQNEIITALDEVIAGTFKTDSEVIAELTQKLSEAQDKYNELNNHAIGDMLDKNSEIEELKDVYEKAIIAVNEVSVLNAGLINANTSLMQESDGYHNANTELNAELNTMRKIAQERAETIQTLKNDAEYLVKKYERTKQVNAILCVVISLWFALVVYLNV